MHLINDENGNPVPHGHGGTGHTHEHTHSQEGSAAACPADCAGGDCRKETVALLSYMLDHNRHHASELDQMADNLTKLGLDQAARQIKDAVADFEKGNMRLAAALASIREEEGKE